MFSGIIPRVLDIKRKGGAQGIGFEMNRRDEGQGGWVESEEERVGR